MYKICVNAQRRVILKAARVIFSFLSPKVAPKEHSPIRLDPFGLLAYLRFSSVVEVGARRV